jgi:hypothetical protein
MRSLLPLLAILASGCGLLDIDLEGAEPNCDTRLPYYPDQDGDGFGATSPVFLGCEAPDGYVETTGDCDDNDPDVIECIGETGDAGDTGDTGDTEPEDTGTPTDPRG